MIDIVTRLRAKASRLDQNGVIGANSTSADMEHAADEIEALRKTICAALDCLHHDDPKQARKILEG